MTAITHAPDQARAINTAVNWYRRGGPGAFRLEGAAGTGKTTIANDIADRCAPEATAYVAPTGKAAAVLRTKGCDGATTVHAAIYAPAGQRTAAITALRERMAKLDPRSRTHAADLAALETELARVRAQPNFTLRAPDKAFGGTKPRLVVLDEASMVDDRMYADLASMEVPILALGDPHQLPPVAGTARWRQGPPDALLTAGHRAANAPTINLATTLRRGHPAPCWDGTAGRILRRWDAARLAAWDQVIVGRNVTRWRVIRTLRQLAGFPDGRPVPGDRIMCLRNDVDARVLNGQQATVTDVIQTDEAAWILAVITDEGQAMWLADARGFINQAGQDEAKRDRDSGMVAATFAHAITCHSAQGSQWGSVAVIDESRVFQSSARQWLYTAATRAEHRCVLLDPTRMVGVAA